MSGRADRRAQGWLRRRGAVARHEDEQAAAERAADERDAADRDSAGRKPPKVSQQSWVERQIRTAQADGAFDNLPGAGRPLPGGRTRSEMDWVVRRVKREDLDVLALLPPSLALPKELEGLPDRLLRERSEDKVRKIVLDLNERIRQAHRVPQAGPPLRAMPVDVEKIVDGWRRSRSAR